MADAPQILAAKPKPNKPEQGVVTLGMPDGSQIEAWTPELAKAIPLQGKPVPSDWKLDDGPYGKRLMPPRGQGGGGGYRNSKEAFDREAASRERWQLLEEDRKDRRTAVMTAFENADAIPTSEEFRPGVEELLRRASAMYAWLSNPSGAEAGGTIRPSRDPAPGPSSPPEQNPRREAPHGDRGRQGGDPSSPAAGPAEPQPSAGAATTERAEAAAAAQPAPRAGASPADSGEAAAGSAPGEALQETQASPGATYPLDPAGCSHRFPSGRWLKWNAEGRCPRCGTSKIVAMEGTTADLGAA